MPPPLLEARNLRKVFSSGGGPFSTRSETVATEDFSISISAESPSFTTVAGESGSGKTTIARLLLGLMAPTSGQVLYRGSDVRGMNRAERHAYRKDVQAIFQDPFEVYNPFYKIDHILTTPIRKFGLAHAKREVDELVAKALEAVGLRPEETLGRYPHQLSGGQRQRITVARALMLQPKLIIADEPVSMVDASLRATILESLHRLYREFAISFIYITHDLTTAYQVTDNIVILYRGAVVEAGDVERVIDKPMHPYTQELIQAIPAPVPGRGWLDEEVEVGGEDETGGAGVESSRGCRYAPRCAHVMDRCRAEMPPLYRTDEGGAAACYLYGENAIVGAREFAAMLETDGRKEA